MRLIFILFISMLQACAVTVKSTQFNAVKGLFDSSRQQTLGRLWTLEYQGRRYEAYALSKGSLVRFYTLGQLEVDFENFSVIRIENFSLPRQHVLIVNQENNSKLIQVDSNDLRVECDAMIQIEEFEYSQSCRSVDSPWEFSNTFKLNNEREIIYIKAYYSAREQPVVLWFSQSFKSK